MFRTYEKLMALEIAKILERLRKHMFDSIGTLRDDEAGRIAYDPMNIGRLDRLVRTLKTGIGTSGVMDEMTKGITELLDVVRTEMSGAGLGRAVSGASIDTMRMLLKGADEEITANLNHAATTVGRYLRSAMVGGVKRADLITRIMDELSTTRHKAQVGADSALASMYRKVLVRSCEDSAEVLGLEVEFGYDGPGPLDKLIRPFCALVHGFRGTSKDWDALMKITKYEVIRGKQPLPVSLWGGGYNCRHRFTPLVGASAKTAYRPLPTAIAREKREKRAA